ncbi:hypothetical protein BGM26_04510 [Bacillus sp. FJAT-29790]|uniref:hypothetical protein n=1 Tax=Bacillus sp. FJAT-29790 TaxID=1895002 RepID=UPI001C21DAE0|nr:hypothetical protein [Bacillus sp. FJAT-29790]MBU8878250.1 hypothetical protein [Bacillus sp. FJAT-29790]
MTTLTRKEIRKVEEYYYWIGYKSWYPFPEELKEKLMSVYGVEPFPHIWTEQDIYEGSRKLIFNYFSNKSM